MAELCAPVHLITYSFFRPLHKTFCNLCFEVKVNKAFIFSFSPQSNSFFWKGERGSRSSWISHSITYNSDHAFFLASLLRHFIVADNVNCSRTKLRANKRMGERREKHGRGENNWITSSAPWTATFLDYQAKSRIGARDTKFKMCLFNLCPLVCNKYS